MNPSVSFLLNENSLEFSSPLTWVNPVGFQDVDYDYQPNLEPPLTADVAKHFPELTAEQLNRVYDYCCFELIIKYKSMEQTQEPYFNKDRYWRLSLYDHKGEVMHFYYRLNKTDIKLVRENEAYLAWTTEVPIAKLYAVLEFGESLTSMYMRINNILFEPDIEKEIQCVDIIEDPLVRCLFSGVFGAYQIAQLKRIKS
jgi:hypothetical protein